MLSSDVIADQVQTIHRQKPDAFVILCLQGGGEIRGLVTDASGDACWVETPSGEEGVTICFCVPYTRVLAVAVRRLDAEARPLTCTEVADRQRAAHEAAVRAQKEALRKAGAMMVGGEAEAETRTQ